MRVTIIASVFVFGACLFLGTGNLRALEPKDFRTMSVIVAKVLEVVSQDDGDYRIRLHPLGTLTGKFDCALEGDIAVQCYIGVPHSSIREAPKKGSTVVALISCAIDNLKNPPETQFYIPNVHLAFDDRDLPQRDLWFEKWGAMGEVDGIGGKDVDKIREFLRQRTKHPKYADFVKEEADIDYFAGPGSFTIWIPPTLREPRAAEGGKR